LANEREPWPCFHSLLPFSAHQWHAGWLATNKHCSITKCAHLLSLCPAAPLSFAPHFNRRDSWLLAQIRPLIAPEGDRRAKPQCPLVRPLRRLEIGTQHTRGDLETHSTAWLWLAGHGQGRACGRRPERHKNDACCPLLHPLTRPFPSVEGARGTTAKGHLHPLHPLPLLSFAFVCFAGGARHRPCFRPAHCHRPR